MRIGVDLGGTKIEVAALDEAGGVLLRRRVATPVDYGGVLAAIAGLVGDAEAATGRRGTVGVGPSTTVEVPPNVDDTHPRVAQVCRQPRCRNEVGYLFTGSHGRHRTTSPSPLAGPRWCDRRVAQSYRSE